MYYLPCFAVVNEMLMMVYLIGPDGLVNQRSANFHKMVWMTTVHVVISQNFHTLILNLGMHIIHIHAVF